MIQLTIPILCALFTILGGLAYVRFNAYYAASAKFRSAVIAELSSIYPTINNWPQNEEAFFKSAFPNLKVAVAEFRYFVPWYSRRVFDNTWLRYYCAYPEQNTNQIYHHYTAFQDNGETASQAQEIRNKTFHSNVSKLLSFACNN